MIFRYNGCIFVHKYFLKMRLPIVFFILAFAFTGCKNKQLSSDYLTTTSVIRETEEGNKKKTETAPANTVNSIPAQTPVKTYNSQPKTEKYYIIVASWNTSGKARAEKLVRDLKAKGYPAELLSSYNKYRVSIESFTTEAEAYKVRDEYREITDRKDIWILKK